MTLRPIERRVLALRDEGQETDEIARRFKRSPQHIDRMIELAALQSHVAAAPAEDADPLRPVERRVLRLRGEGVTYEELGDRFRRSADHMRRIEQLAHYKLGT
jgi:DNA-binding CsgD family transcriptional regulator